MLFKPLTVAALAASAATTHAFLLPPELSESDVQIAEAVETVPLLTALSKVVRLDCPGCPAPRPHLRSQLELSFSIDHRPDGGDADRLLLNGFELYPNSDPFRSVLTATQIVERPERPDNSDDAQGEWRLEPQPLGFGMHTGFAGKDADGGGLELVAVDLQIIEIGSTFIAGLPELQIKLIKTPSGQLMIGKIEISETVPVPQDALPPSEKKTEEEGEKEECTTPLCRLIALVSGSRPPKPCHGSGAAEQSSSAEHRPHHGGSHHGGPPQWAGQNGHGRHGGWRKMHRHHEHSWGQLFKNIASHILLPVFIGIVAGVSVSLIGMVVGTVIVSLWRTFARRPHHHHRRHHSSGHSRRKSVQKEVAVDDSEKSGLMEHQDPPPSYEAEDVKKDADAAIV